MLQFVFYLVLSALAAFSPLSAKTTPAASSPTFELQQLATSLPPTLWKETSSPFQAPLSEVLADCTAETDDDHHHQLAVKARDLHLLAAQHFRLAGKPAMVSPFASKTPRYIWYRQLKIAQA
jgi:hypothetical protein